LNRDGHHRLSRDGDCSGQGGNTNQSSDNRFHLGLLQREMASAFTFKRLFAGLQ
jgi:hypothetical protein